MQRNAGYTTMARLIHWVVALLVLAMIPAGLVMVQEGLPRALQDTLFVFHKNFGVILLLLMLARLVYRRRNPPPALPDHMPGWQQRVAVATHVALYALLLIQPVVGYVRVRAGGFPIEWLDAMGVPALVPRSKPLAEAAMALHGVLAFVIIGVAAMHVGAALFHLIVRRDGVFARMWPPVAAPAPDPAAPGR